MSDYPMLISNKLHSFRNFREQSYELIRCVHGFTDGFISYYFSEK